jgi:hypothetical protein
MSIFINQNKPYTYLIGWTKYDIWYYGVRFAKNCCPDELWVTYFTSSKYVKAFRKERGEPDIIQIRKIFDDAKSAYLWETKVLKRLKVTNSDRWLNRSDNHSIRTDVSSEERKKWFTAETSKKMSDSRKKWILENKEKALEIIKNARIYLKFTPERNKKISLALTNREITWGSKISDNHKRKGVSKGKNNPMYGRSAITENNLKWYTNGVEVIYVTENTQPPGFVRGRKIGNSSLKWYTNGIKTIFVEEGTQPPEFVKGRKIFPSS